MKKFDADFKRNQFFFLVLANKSELEAEQAVVHNHIDKVTVLLYRLVQLLPEPDKVSKKLPAITVTKGLLKQLRYDFT